MKGVAYVYNIGQAIGEFFYPPERRAGMTTSLRFGIHVKRGNILKRIFANPVVGMVNKMRTVNYRKRFGVEKKPGRIVAALKKAVGIQPAADHSKKEKSWEVNAVHAMAMKCLKPAGGFGVSFRRHWKLRRMTERADLKDAVEYDDKGAEKKGSRKKYSELFKDPQGRGCVTLERVYAKVSEHIVRRRISQVLGEAVQECLDYYFEQVLPRCTELVYMNNYWVGLPANAVIYVDDEDKPGEKTEVGQQSGGQGTSVGEKKGKKPRVPARVYKIDNSLFVLENTSVENSTVKDLVDKARNRRRKLLK